MSTGFLERLGVAGRRGAPAPSSPPDVRTRNLTELVAQEVQDGRILGYVSSPKQATPPS